jgi:hypothetical protein
MGADLFGSTQNREAALTMIGPFRGATVISDPAPFQLFLQPRRWVFK